MANLFISEIFSSIQGEGKFCGVPSVFMRLTGCNLLCGGRGTDKDGKLHGSATWRCDTIEVWQKGEKYTISDSINALTGKYDFTGRHLVITGGEPLLQMDALEDFLRMFPQDIFIEVETNGTILPSALLQDRVDHWNVSPKLVNSGMSANKRFGDEVGLRYFGEVENSIFKFVINKKEDLLEIFSDFNIDPEKLWLMPASDTREALIENAQKIAEWCIEMGIKYSSRLQLEIWDQKTGV